MKRYFWIIVFLICGFICCHIVSIEVEAFELKNDQMVLHFDDKTGKIFAVDFKGVRVCQSEVDRQWFDFNIGGKWQFGKHSMEFKGLKKVDDHTAIVSIGYGDWLFDYEWKIDVTDAEFHCNIQFQYNGKEEVRLKGMWFDFPNLVLEEGSTYFGPGIYPPKQYSIRDMKSGEKKSFYRATPILIVERNPKCSFLFLNDDLGPTSDIGGISIENIIDRKNGTWALRPSWNSECSGRMKTGTVQKLGSFWCRLIPGDGEKALLSIHSWMKKTGNIIPKDRPKWFESAILYSFHPGGTIGSDCKDLGGFVNSLPLLDRIYSLNMNAIWLMPLEDVSIYCPRDYYKFQVGLGTGDEYKQLVKKAHALQLHVLQDCVPHGGKNIFQRAIDHPEWLVYDEEGKSFDYWCFDFNYPTWRQYMAGVADHYVKEYNIDGYRVDAVGGSRIPNWNKDIPYSRASYARRQGGLNMLRSLRTAVQNNKPGQAGLLAETPGSVYGAVSDAIYDFTGCYNAYHHLRYDSAKQFVDQLRRWLHEEQYSEIEGLLRLRHSESHDSLRTMLWYGIEPGRAIVALTSFIHGIPLVYHDEDIGHFYVFRKLFDMRNRLPELQGGKPDYIGVKVPDGVFAVRRSKDDNESIALINFNETPVNFKLETGKNIVVTDMMKDEIISTQNGVVQVHLDPYRYNVYALREVKKLDNTGIANGVAVMTPSIKSGEDKKSDLMADINAAPTQVITLTGDRYQVQIDRQTGLLLAFDEDGKTVLGASDLWLPPNGTGESANHRKQKSDITISQDGKTVECVRNIDGTRLSIRYKANKDSLDIESSWSGEQIPVNAVMSFSVKNAVRWNAVTAEGTLDDVYRIRPEGGVPGTSSIYWRVQGTDVLYDSLLCPLSPLSENRAVLGVESSNGKGCTFSMKEIPVRVQWMAKTEKQKNLTALLYWSNSEVPFNVAPQWSITLRPGKNTLQTETTSDVLTSMGMSFKPVAGGWLFQNNYYRLYLDRNGSIQALTEKGSKEDAIVKTCDIYTDYGFGTKGVRYSSRNEVEAGSRLDFDGRYLRLRFNGRPRGFGRFELLNPGLDYSLEYLLGKGPSFELSAGVKSNDPKYKEMAFLAYCMNTERIDSFEFKRAEKVLASGNPLKQKGRSWQSKGRESPDTITLFSDQKPLMTLSAIQGDIPGNIFMDNKNFFMVFDDGESWNKQEEHWSLLCTIGSNQSEKLPRQTVKKSIVKRDDILLANGEMERQVETNLVSDRSGEYISLMKRNVRDWQIPHSGRYVSKPVSYAGKSCLEIVNTTGDYLLARQTLPLVSLPEGSHWRFSAMVKGENIVRGKEPWMDGCLRWLVQVDNKRSYINSPSQLGTFDWKKVSVDFTVPKGTSSIQVEMGLNGATGKIWLDNAIIEKIDE